MTGDLEKYTVYDVIMNGSKGFLSQEVGSFFKISAKCDRKDGTITHYDVLIIKINWFAAFNKTAHAIVLNDVTHIIAAHKFADDQKNRIIQTISHELRTPINGIIAMLAELKRSYVDSSASELIFNCQNCTTLLLNLVNSIIDLI